MDTLQNKKWPDPTFASLFSLVTNKTYKSMITGNYEQMVKSKYVE